MFTIAQWVVLVFLLLIGLGISVAFLVDKDTRIAGLAIVFSTIIVTILLAIFLNWYNRKRNQRNERFPVKPFKWY